jgi:hypothetical protein
LLSVDHQEMARRGTVEEYLLGGLDAGERTAFEEHFFDCPECAADVRAGATFLATARPLLGEGLSDEPVKPRGLAGPARTTGLRGQRAFLAAVSSLAAVLCLTAYQGLVVIPRLQKEVESLDALRAVPSYFLTVARSETPTIAVLPGDRHVVLTLSQSWDRPYPAYRCRLQDAAGRVLLEETVTSRSTTSELELLLPVGGLASGSYALAVFGGETRPGPKGDGTPVAQYQFQLTRR